MKQSYFLLKEAITLPNAHNVHSYLRSFLSTDQLRSKRSFVRRLLSGLSLWRCELVCTNVIMSVSVCVMVGACDQVDNSCFCFLCRLVFQDISGRLPQVGFTHSVWEPVCILLVSNDCVLLDIIDHLRLKCLLCPLLLTHWILTYVELRKGEKGMKLGFELMKNRLLTINIHKISLGEDWRTS